MAAPSPGAVLFVCDWNAVRSPMAEGMAKAMLGLRVFVQSAGARGVLPLDSFAVEVCREIGIDISKHSTHDFNKLDDWAEDIREFDLIVAMSPAALHLSLELTAGAAVEVDRWPVLDPTDIGERREQKLAAYRQTRDEIRDRIIGRFGLPG